MEKIEFTIPGKPIPWTAPRLGRRCVFSPHASDKKRLIIAVKNLYRGAVLKEPLNCSLSFYVPIPDSTTKKNRQLMLEGKIRPVKKPDRTNYGKLYEDVMEKIIYANDSQIVGGSVEKWYSDNPRVVVKIECVSMT